MLLRAAMHSFPNRNALLKFYVDLDMLKHSSILEKIDRCNSIITMISLLLRRPTTKITFSPATRAGLVIYKECFLNFGTVFLTSVRMRKLRKAHCSPPLVGEDNSMVFTSHSVPFPATRDLRSLVARNGTS